MLFALLTVTAFMVLPRRDRTLTWFFILFIVIIALWRFIPQSNDRDWQRDVAILPYATLNRDEITIHNIRNLNYRTEKDFDVRYYDRAFHINKLDSVDLFAVYWAGNAIAHIMMSFGFAGKDYVVFSIETRKSNGKNTRPGLQVNRTRFDDLAKLQFGYIGRKTEELKMWEIAVSHCYYSNAREGT